MVDTINMGMMEDGVTGEVYHTTGYPWMYPKLIAHDSFLNRRKFDFQSVQEWPYGRESMETRSTLGKPAKCEK